MPWEIIAVPAIASAVYGFLLGLKSIEAEKDRLIKKEKSGYEDRH